MKNKTEFYEFSCMKNEGWLMDTMLKFMFHFMFSESVSIVPALEPMVALQMIKVVQWKLWAVV